MFINYSICGGVTVNNARVVSKYVVKNLTTGYISKELLSELGYYSFNLTDFKDIIFNTGDILSIEFYVRYNGIDYYTTLYDIINEKAYSSVKAAELVSNWTYNSSINSIITGNSVAINFVTTYYSNIIYKLYIKYDGEYREIDTAILNRQSLTINLSSSGEYRIAGYVVNGNTLLSYAYKDITITSNARVTSKRYIEWE